MIATATRRRAPVLREATAADVPRLQAMFAQFVASTQYARYVGQDPAASTATIALLVGGDTTTVWVAEREDQIIGMLSVAVFRSPWCGEILATEGFWWLDPAHRGFGVFLLRRAERWAHAKGAVRMQMMAPADNPRVAEIYEALGYARVELIFQKDLL